MHDLNLIFTLTGGFIAAVALGYFTQRIGLSPIVGYLVAGILVSPNTPGFAADPALAEQLAEVGVILLMFGVGLQFHVQELLAVRRLAIPGAIGQSLAATALGAAAMHALGWSWPAGIVFGLAISVASTVVLMRVLSDHGHLHTPAGHIAVGWLVVEDLFTVFVIVLLPAVFGAGGGTLDAAGLVKALGVTGLKIGLLVALTLAGGGWLIPRLLRRIAMTKSRELFTLAILAVALGVAVGSAAVFGVSMALGAFLGGLVVGRSAFGLRAESEALPLRDAFAVLFFVSVGMLVDLRGLVSLKSLVAVALAVILVGKPVASFVIVVLLKHPLRQALAVSAALAQIGEFSFILATLGRQLGVLPAEASNLLVVCAVVSITLNPPAYRLVPVLEGWIERRLPGFAAWVRRRSLAEPEKRTQEHDQEQGDRVIVVGYGPVGRTLARLLRENHLHPVVIELNYAAVEEMQSQRIEAIYGDAARPDILDRAKLASARALILSSSGMAGASETIRLAREKNPRIRVIARTAFLREQTVLDKAGADVVFSGEAEVALAMTEHLLEELGASPEQIDRERRRVHGDLARSVNGTP